MSKQLTNYQYLTDPTGKYPEGGPSGEGARTNLGIAEYVDNAAAVAGGLAAGSLYYNTTSETYVLVS